MSTPARETRPWWEPLRRWLAEGREAFATLVFPWECPVCGAEGDGSWSGAPFCPDCRAELVDAAGPACPRCAMPVGPYGVREEGCAECRGRRLGFDAAIALGPYQGPIRDVCLRLKREPNAWMARWLADVLLDGRPGLRDEFGEAGAWVVPVPLHWRRRWQRGYNQSDELAVHLAKALSLPRRDALRRVKATRLLAGLGRVERSKALRGAFRVRTRASAGLKGRTVLLVDDVLTTGATCGAAARALKRAGARRVVALVVARAGGRTEVRKADDVVNVSKRVQIGMGSAGGDVSQREDGPTSQILASSQETNTNMLRIGTRGSPLARWQAEWVADRLRTLHPGLTVELIEIKTHGDRDRNTPLAQMGGLGLFTKEIQRALLDGAVDVAVHSLKDLPTQGPGELTLGAVPPREDLADALVAPKYKTLDALPDGATVGTGSLRRRAQLLFLRPGLNVVAVRGNVETRLNQALGGTLDAVVLAEAGLRRLGLDAHVTERLGPPGFLPAVGQGALGIECRRDDQLTLDRLAPLNDPPTRRAVVAERRALAELEGGCMIPLGAWGRDLDDGRMALDVAVYEADGRERVLVSLDGPPDDPEGLGLRAAESLRKQGAERLLRRSGPAGEGASAGG